MLPCVGCKYFTGDAYCWVKSYRKSYINEVAGTSGFYAVGQELATEMRKINGACGPDRALYMPTTKFIVYSTLRPYYKYALIIGYSSIITAYLIRHFST